MVRNQGTHAYVIRGHHVEAKGRAKKVSDNRCTMECDGWQMLASSNHGKLLTGGYMYRYIVNISCIVRG